MDREIIRSRSNEKIVEAAKLHRKKYRDEKREFCFEGKKLLLEAINAKVDILALFYTPKNCEFVSALKGSFEKIPVTESVYEKLTDENSPEGLFCVAKYLDRIKFLSKIYKDEKITSPFIVAGVQDPGNLGTLIRSALALNTGTLIISNDCADVYARKTLRASMGALFGSDILVVNDINSVPASLLSKGYSVYAATPHKNSTSLGELLASRQNICFAVGNEGHGLSESFINCCQGCVTIPMNKSSESLNVTAAATILMWENFKKQL